MSNQSLKKPDIDPQAAVAALEYLFAAGYINKKKLYLENFLRGMFFSIGSIVGLTLIATLLLWVLSLLDSIPFIDQVADGIKRAIDR